MEPRPIPVVAAYGERVTFYYTLPHACGPRYDVPIRFPDFEIRLTKYGSYDHANVEMEEFVFEAGDGSDNVVVEYSFDHGSDTAYHGRQPERFSLSGVGFKLWHYASREGLKYDEFVITKE
ncbi:MAG: hypothetical protein HYY17_08495 [Planctomycetes bacterium]|nr:hypothetical protein [Planctomycetota bacterium]